MIKVCFTAAFVFCALSSISQVYVDKSAQVAAIRMVNFFNVKDYKSYVENLLPIQYGNREEGKIKFAEMLANSNKNSEMKITEVLHFKKVDEKNGQVLIRCQFNGNVGFVFGVSEDNGRNWLFTQFLNKGIQLSFLLKIIPNLDPSFYTIVDPKFGKRIDYKVNETLPKFSFREITGRSLSSDSIDQIIVLNFWSVSCGPCIEEIEALNELVSKNKNNNVVFIALSFYSPLQYLTDNFLISHPFLYRIVNISNSDDFEVNEFPTHIIIDRKKVIRQKLIGASPENMNLLTNAIDNLLKE